MSKIQCSKKLCYSIVAISITIIALFILSIDIGLSDRIKTFLGLLFWGVLFLVLYMCRPNSFVHQLHLDTLSRKYRVFTVIIIFIVIIACILPMGLFPLWNGTLPSHRNQYELTAKAFLDGHLYIEYGDEQELLELNNPYDPVERKEKNVSFHWDHAFYNGHYYMYFGVVPVVLLFLPYRLVTGVSLTTFHATQIFVALIVIGFFILFKLLSRLFFKELSYGVYLFFSVSSSIISSWWSIAEPSLYATAITAGIMFELWSIIFFVKAVWDTEGENKQIIMASFGALLGALTFGCRPTIGLANLIVIPLLFSFLSKRKITKRIVCKLILAAMPYVIVAILLMWYNYARFENPFEFGQSYQLTVADQTNIGSIRDINVKLRLINETILNFIGYCNVSEKFPYIHYDGSGVFTNYPIFLVSLAMFRSNIWKHIKKLKLTGFIVTLTAIPLLITIFDVLWSPFLLERYRLDIYFVIAILAFMITGFLYEENDMLQNCRLGSIIMVLSVAAALTSIAYYIQLTSVFNPIIIDWAREIICFWTLY